jgi:hypothetical protein
MRRGRSWCCDEVAALCGGKLYTRKLEARHVSDVNKYACAWQLIGSSGLESGPRASCPPLLLFGVDLSTYFVSRARDLFEIPKLFSLHPHHPTTIICDKAP